MAQRWMQADAICELLLSNKYDYDLYDKWPTKQVLVKFLQAKYNSQCFFVQLGIAAFCWS